MSGRGRGRPRGSTNAARVAFTGGAKRFAPKGAYRRRQFGGSNSMGSMVKYKPRVDQVVTRTFKYIFKPNQIEPEFSANTDCFIGNIKNGIFARAYLFNVVDVPGLNPYIGPTGPFTSYRVDEIKYRFVAVGTTAIVDDTDNGGATQIQKTQPMIYFGVINGSERQGELLYQSEDQAVFDSTRHVKCGQDFVLKFVPNTLTYHQSQRESVGAAITNPVLVPKKGQWNGDRFNYIIGTSPSLGSNFYGFKVLVGNSSAEDGEYVYKVFVTIKVSFRGQSDNANQQITATGGFNHRIFAS